MKIIDWVCFILIIAIIIVSGLEYRKNLDNSRDICRKLQEIQIENYEMNINLLRLLMQNAPKDAHNIRELAQNIYIIDQKLTPIQKRKEEDTCGKSTNK